MVAMLKWKGDVITITLCFNGALNTNRTCDLPLRRGLLYPLSYQGANRILR